MSDIIKYPQGKMYLTSRSAIECYQTCPRRRYLNYHYEVVKGQNGGIVPVRRNLALLVGVAVHKGVEFLFHNWDLPLIENAVLEARTYFQDSAVASLIADKGAQTQEQMIWTIAEHRALVEALVRLWFIAELPRLQASYTLESTEKEMTYDLGNNIILQSRLDAILRSKKKPDDIYGYSLKTGKQWGSKMEQTFAVDLQSLTETFVASHNLGTRVTATIFCHLIKGKREENKNTGNFETSNPFIRGYRKAGIGAIEYAHSFFYPNPLNASGRGALGKGWGPFNVWSKRDGYEGGVKQWMTDIYNRKIQSDINPTTLFNQWCVVPVESFRSSLEIQDAMEQIAHQERIVFHNLHKSQLDINVTFPMYRESCYWPTDCDFLPVCHGKAAFTGTPVDMGVAQDPVGSGYYEKRIPHHELIGDDL